MNFVSFSLKPGDVVMETEVISQPLSMKDPTFNSTHKNIIDWFLGAVGFKPENNPEPSSTTPQPTPPSLKCPSCSKYPIIHMLKTLIC